jgi:Mg-chelatase subunit ChlD
MGIKVALTFLLAGVLTIVAPEKPNTKNILLVVDTSCSMSDSLDKAVDVAMSVAEVNDDDYRLGCITFAGSSSRWMYNGEMWADMPDARAVNQLRGFLKSFEAAGTTSIADAMRWALKGPQDELTIMVISDGKFFFDPSPGIWAYQDLRKEAAIITTISTVNEISIPMYVLGKIGKGGYFVIK